MWIAKPSSHRTNKTTMTPQTRPAMVLPFRECYAGPRTRKPPAWLPSVGSLKPGGASAAREKAPAPGGREHGRRMPSESTPSVACVGGADVDRKLTLVPAVPSGVTSLCGRAVTRFGGVARSVAHNLVRLGIATSLISLTGDDDDGRALLRELERDGVDVRGVRRI